MSLANREAQWIAWTEAALPADEREDLLRALTAEQRAHLLAHDYVWVAGLGVLWKPSDGGPLRRSRFTHGIHFRTRHAELYMDAEGGVRGLSGGL